MSNDKSLALYCRRLLLLQCDGANIKVILEKSFFGVGSSGCATINRIVLVFIAMPEELTLVKSITGA